jgi:GTPase SAR1 family protein
MYITYYMIYKNYKIMSEIFKILLVGDVSTGKTSFLTQLIFQAA